MRRAAPAWPLTGQDAVPLGDGGHGVIGPDQRRLAHGCRGQGERASGRAADAAGGSCGDARLRAAALQLSALTGAMHRHGAQAEQSGQQERGTHCVEALVV